METNPQVLPDQALPVKSTSGFTPAIRPLIFAVIACAAVIVLFSPAGIIFKQADLSFLVAPFLSYYILRFGARLSSIYLPAYSNSLTAGAASAILTGIAFSVFFFLFLGNAELLTRVGVFSHIGNFLKDLATTPGYAVLFVSGLTVSKLSRTMRETASGKGYSPVVNALGQIVTGIGIWQFLAAFSEPSGTPDKIGLVIFAGMIAVAVSNIGHYGENSQNPFIADASHWLNNSGFFEFITGAFIATYILFIRPFITDIFNYAAIAEWMVVCFLGWRLFSGIKNGIRARSAVEVHEIDWQKHVQFINNLQGADFPQIGDIQEVFIKDSSRDSLLIYLALVLHNNKVSPEEIHRILHPLINHQDVKMPWFAFGWEQRRVLKQNEMNRRLILGEIMANLKYIMNPANQKIEEHVNE